MHTPVHQVEPLHPVHIIVHPVQAPYTHSVSQPFSHSACTPTARTLQCLGLLLEQWVYQQQRHCQSSTDAGAVYEHHQDPRQAWCAHCTVTRLEVIQDLHAATQQEVSVTRSPCLAIGIHSWRCPPDCTLSHSGKSGGCTGCYGQACIRYTLVRKGGSPWGCPHMTRVIYWHI